MTENLKALWDGLAGEMKASPEALQRPEVRQRFEALMAPVNELLKQFRRERDHQPFDSQAPCPICGGIVTYWYRAPLIGGMRCESPDCIAVNL